MKPRILIIDDNENIRHQLMHFLKKDCPEYSFYVYDPQIKGRPGRSFNWLTYDLVLLDTRLGDESGLEWLREIKSVEASPAVIMLCGRSEPKLVERLKEFGADECLTKSKLNRTQLASTVRYIIKYSKLTRSREEVSQRKKAGPDVPGYKMVKLLNSTDSSALYLVNSEKDNRPYVIKTLFSEWLDDDLVVDRFINEYELINTINNPHLVKLHQLSFTEEFVYIIMDYLPGGSLFERIQQAVLNESEIMFYMRQVLSGLAALHSQGILHRDLKPSNIMFYNRDHLVVIDFGISKQLTVCNGDITHDNVVLGTLGYMSPEAVTGTGLDERSDIYSLGIMFYEMLLRKRPFRPQSPQDVLNYHRRSDSFQLPEYLAVFQPLLDKMIATNRTDRFPNVTCLLEYMDKVFPPPAI